MSSSTEQPDGKNVKKTQKFMFDTQDFGVDTSAEEKAPIFTEEQMLAARAEGHVQGRAEALKEARASQEEKTMHACEKMLAQAGKLLEAETRREILKQTQSLDMVLHVIEKVAPSLASAGALAEALKTITMGLEEHREEPRIVVTVHDSLFQAIKERVDKISADRNFTGKLIVMADPAIPPTDCRVEWADGGMERSFDRLLSAINEEIKKMKETLTNNGDMK